MARCWFVVWSLVLVPLATTVSSLAIADGGAASGTHVALKAATSASEPDSVKNHDVGEIRTHVTSDLANRRFRRHASGAANDNLRQARSADDDDASRRSSADDEVIKKLSARLPPHVDRYNLYPFDHYDYPLDHYDYQDRRSGRSKLATIVRRLESLAAANQLRRLAAANGEEGDVRPAASSVRRSRHDDGIVRNGNRAPDAGNEFVDEDDGEEESEWQGRRLRSFDTLGGGMIPIKRHHDSAEDGIVPIGRKSTAASGKSYRSEYVREGLRDRWMPEPSKKTFDSLGGGMLPIKRRIQAESVPTTSTVGEGDDRLPQLAENEAGSKRRRNFDSLGGGLLPI